MAEVNLDEIKVDYQTGAIIKSESEASPEREKLEPIVSSEDFVKKNDGPFKTFLRAMCNDADDMKHYVLHDVLVPGLKSTTLDVLSRLFYNQGFTSSRKSVNSGTAYDKMFTQGSKYHYKPARKTYAESPSRRAPINDDIKYDEIVFSNRDKAENFVRRLYSRIDMSEDVSIAEVYDLLGQRSDWTDANWGWNSKQAINIVKVPQGWYIDFDEPVQI
jgi:hypothetical protein